MSELKKLVALIKGNRILFLLGAAGLLLLLIGGIWRGTAKEPARASPVSDCEAYRAGLEATLEEACAEIRGVGRVSITLTLASSEITVYETNESGTGHSVAVVGGEALPIAYRFPEVMGVAVVCTGGADPTVQRELYNFLGAVLGLSTTQIHVAPAR